MSNPPPDPNAKKAGWERWYAVTKYVPNGHKLYRASAPNYDGHNDSSQDLTQPAVDFLVSKGVDSIISFNEKEYKPEEKKRLDDAKPKIYYKHLKLEDFHPPTLAQLQEAYTFFLAHKSTLVHCGYGWGRTGTGVTGLQIYTENGTTLQPLSSLWITLVAKGGNNVEKRGQVSVLANQRNIFLPKVKGTPAGDSNKTFFVINFATGYYLTVDKGSVTTNVPEKVESTSPIDTAYHWVISKNSNGDYSLSNKKTTGFALTESNPKVNDPVTYATAPGSKNSLFSLREVTKNEGRYIISPKPQANLQVAIKAPDGDDDYSISNPAGARLENKNEKNEYGLWILVASDFK